MGKQAYLYIPISIQGTNFFACLCDKKSRQQPNLLFFGSQKIDMRGHILANVVGNSKLSLFLSIGFLNSFSASITILTFYGIIFEVGDRFYNMSCADCAAAIPSPCQWGPRQMSKNHAVSHACLKDNTFQKYKMSMLFVKCVVPGTLWDFHWGKFQ